MNRKLQIALKRWLLEERRAGVEAPEAALRRVFESLPATPLPAGFAERVMARAGLVSASTRRLAWIAAFGWKAVLSASLLLVALSIVLLPGVLKSLAPLLGPASLVELAAGTLVGVGQRLGEGLAVWGALSDASAILFRTLDSWPVATVLALCLTLSTGAFRLLYELISVDGSTRYAGST